MASTATGSGCAYHAPANAPPPPVPRCPVPARPSPPQCTFEANCAELLNREVAIAGKGVSCFQHAVRRLGSYTPALKGDHVLRELCRLNLALYLYLSAFLLTAMASSRREAVSVLSTHSEALGKATDFSYVFIVLLQFLWLRSTLSAECSLANNAKRVLTIMTKRARSHSLGSDSTVATPPQGIVLRELPWLMAYDRRDTLVVFELIERLEERWSPCDLWLWY